MPTVNVYADSSDKTGYYVTAFIGGPHPINIQTQPLANRIFSELGFTGGETITHNLCWNMYNVGLLTTNNSGVDDTDALITEYGNGERELSLTEEQQTKLASILGKYANSSQIEELQDLLDTTVQVNQNTATDVDNSNTADSGDTEGSLQEIIESFDIDLKYNTETDDTIEISDETIEQLAEWDIPVDDVIDTLNNYPEEAAPYLDWCISRFSEYKYTPTTITLSSDGIPEIQFEIEPDHVSHVMDLHVTFKDYLAQTSGRYTQIDAKMRCSILTEFDGKITPHHIDGIIMSGSFVEFTADPTIEDVLNTSTDTDLEIPYKVYIRAVNSTKQFLEETLDVFHPECDVEH